MKPMYLALGAGALLLLKNNAKPKPHFDQAAAAATAQGASMSLSLSTGSKEVKLQAENAQLELAEDELAPPAVEGLGPTFGPTHNPTPFEFAMLYSISPVLAVRAVPDVAFRRQLSDEIARNNVLNQLATRALDTRGKLDVALQLMTPQQTRFFAADCLEMALPVFEKNFPGNRAGANLVEAIHLFANGDPHLRVNNVRRMQAAMKQVVSVCLEKAADPGISAFMSAAVCASVTKEDFGRIPESKMADVKKLMVGALRRTGDFAVQIKKAEAVAKQQATKAEKIRLKRPPSAHPAIARENKLLAESIQARLYHAEKTAAHESEQDVLRKALKGLL